VLNCHCTVGVGLPLAAAVKIAVPPAFTVAFTGFVVIAGPIWANAVAPNKKLKRAMLNRWNSEAVLKAEFIVRTLTMQSGRIICNCANYRRAVFLTSSPVDSLRHLQAAAYFELGLVEWCARRGSNSEPSTPEARLCIQFHCTTTESKNDSLRLN
jgi:hypothetical protein